MPRRRMGEWSKAPCIILISALDTNKWSALVGQNFSNASTRT